MPGAGFFTSFLRERRCLVIDVSSFDFSKFDTAEQKLTAFWLFIAKTPLQPKQIIKQLGIYKTTFYRNVKFLIASGDLEKFENEPRTRPRQTARRNRCL
jgi:hypothetical protein